MRVQFLSLPVEILHRDDCLFPGEARDEREKRRAERVIVNNAIAREQNVKAAEKSVHGGLHVLGANSGNANDFHSGM
jgi:hypothetical protein